MENKNFIKVRCIKIEGTYVLPSVSSVKPMGDEKDKGFFQGAVLTRLVLNNIFLVQETNPSVIPEAYFVYEEKDKNFIGIYSKMCFITIEDWRNLQLNKIL
jgi:hypothetical protein